VHWIIFFLLNLNLISFLIYGVENPRCCREDKKKDFDTAFYKEKMRFALLNRFDQFLDFATNPNLKNNALIIPLKETKFTVNNLALINFAKEHGYFSVNKPIVAHVSIDANDLECVICVLDTLIVNQDFEKNKNFLGIASAELLAKALAYRDLKQDQYIPIPIVKDKVFVLEKFCVDHIFNLWNGMPAFGLIPENQNIPSIILFRGTDFSLTSKRGWASLLSDIDEKGPGFTVFSKARSEIHQWLDKVAKQNKKAISVGFSLGGLLAAYTFFYEKDLLSEWGSVAFNPPGISQYIAEEWNKLSRIELERFTTYINRGDIICKMGYLFGTTYEIYTDHLMKPLFAHTVLISGQQNFILAEVNVERENSQRHR
jgi:hypothetical protein